MRQITIASTNSCLGLVWLHSCSKTAYLLTFDDNATVVLEIRRPSSPLAYLTIYWTRPSRAFVMNSSFVMLTFVFPRNVTFLPLFLRWCVAFLVDGPSEYPYYTTVARPYFLSHSQYSEQWSNYRSLTLFYVGVHHHWWCNCDLVHFHFERTLLLKQAYLEQG